MSDITPSILLQLLKKEEEKRAAEGSFYEFIKQAWPVVEPGVPFTDGWHIKIIAEHLEAVTNGQVRRLLINIPPRMAFTLDTLVPTPEGMVPIKDISLGSIVFGPDGQPIRVTGKSEVFKNRQVYRVTTNDGAYVDVDGDHLWTVRLDRKGGTYQTYTTEQLWKRQNGSFLRTKRGGGVDIREDANIQNVRPPRLPDFKAVNYQEKNFLIDPYVLGVWLGDGSSAGARVSMSKEDAKTVRAEIERRGYRTSDSVESQLFGVLGLRVQLRKLNLLNNKHIPEQYLRGSVQQRTDLLKGLMDTDGHVQVTGVCHFSQSSKEFITQVQQLIRSLGVKCSVLSWQPKGKSTYKRAYRVTFCLTNVAMLERKNKRATVMNPKFGRSITIEKTERFEDTQCISVDREDGLFLVGEGYIVTHNSKSTLVSVMFPVWEWIKSPHQKYLCASYSSVLSTRDALKSRRLIQSPWFQERWGDRFKLSGDQNIKSRYENDHTGYRIATSVGGSATGDGGSRLILDDPHNAQEAQSDVIRESTIEWMASVWSSRLNNAKTDANIVVMQRLHEKDISGYILEELGGWEHILIPMEYDKVKRRTVLGAYDPRTEEGELISPDRLGPSEVATLKTMLRVYGSSGQLQQNPEPSGGGILKTNYIQLWPSDKGLPQFEYILQSYDCAFTEKTTGDPTACSVWAVFTYQGQRNVMLVDAWDEHLSYPDMRSKVVKDWSTEYGGMSKENAFHKARRPDRILIEEKASGQSLLQDLRLAKVPAIGYNPGRADKVSRAHQAAPTLELGMVWVPESAKTPGHPVSWAAQFMKQLAKFPVAEHDDYVDTFTQAIIYLKNDRWFELPKAKDYDAIERPPKERINPYAV